MIFGNDKLTTLSLSHVHVAFATPTVRNKLEQGHDKAATFILSVLESKVTKMASPLSERRTEVNEGAGSREDDCITLTATLAPEYRSALPPDSERVTVQLAAILVVAER